VVARGDPKSKKCKFIYFSASCVVGVFLCVMEMVRGEGKEGEEEEC
jgi:hypothetical protein